MQWIANSRANAGFGDDQAFRGQRLHHFTHHRARDLKTCDEVRLRRHVVARSMNPAQDLGSQDGRDLIVARQSPIHSEAAQPWDGARDGLALL